MSITSIAIYFVSMILCVGFAARPKVDDFIHDEASLPSWMASETGSSAKAQAIPQVRKESMDDRLSSVNGYDWSRSAPSTIPSLSANTPIPIEDYGLAETAPPTEEEHQPEPIQLYPPQSRGPRNNDDLSTLTWDAGY